MITLKEALKIINKQEKVKVYRYAENEDNYAFSTTKPGEIVYGPRPYIVSKRTGTVSLYPFGLNEKWPYSKWIQLKEENQ